VQASRAPRARRPEEGWSAADARSLKASRGRAHNLPVQLTSFIGRQRQIDEIRRLLGEARLVTLTGAGGVGKTRLAQAIAERELSSYAAGAWQVELAGVTEPPLVARVTASTLRTRDQPRRSPTEALVAFIGPRRMLILLDNCEHLSRYGATQR